MRNLVFVEKAQPWAFFGTFSIGSGGMQMGNYLERLADVVDHVRDGLERRVVAVEEALDADFHLPRVMSVHYVQSQPAQTIN